MYNKVMVAEGYEEEDRREAEAESQLLELLQS